ncbi:MAG: zinc ribbon domain-containing protein [Mycobacterium sp.]|nr:zinc ribbon domain-containing protein [Mycobacterium sp.]
MTSSLFPQLPWRSRAQFRLGLIIVMSAAVGFALLRLQVPVVAVSVFGLPVLFAVYLRVIDVFSGGRRRLFLLAMVCAVGLGVAWALVAGPIVAGAYKAALGGQTSLAQMLLCGVAIPSTFGLTMVLPAALVRAVDRSRGEALDGFTIGAVGATVVNASATATLLAPQLTMGVTADSQSVGGLLAEALVEGVAWPLGSVAAGGGLGIALWFVPKADAARRYRRTVVIPAAVLGALAFAVSMGVVDVAPLPLGPYIGLQLIIAVAAVLAVRIVIADALLHEWTEDHGGEQLRCAECDRVVAYRAFCSDCGAAVRAASRKSRASRIVGPEAQAGSDATGMPRPTTSHLSVVGPVVAGVGAAVAVAVVVAIAIKPAPPAYACPPNCGGPSTGKPVEANPRFSGDNGAFSVAYPGENPAYEVTFDPPGINGVQLNYLVGDTGVLTLFGEPAGKRTPEQVAQEILQTKYHGARVAYEIPNASVGYEPGYGVAADVYPRDTSSTYNRTRVIVMVAIRHDYALIATAAGPYHEFSPDFGSGHPSGANLELAMDMGKYVNSFRWYGDRYRTPS